MRRTGWAAALAVVLCVLAATLTPAGAGASQTVHLYASFTPNRPGVSTTITFGFTVSSHDEPAPSPLLGVNLHLPAGIGLGHTTLGTAVCNPQASTNRAPKAARPTRAWATARRSRRSPTGRRSCKSTPRSTPTAAPPSKNTP